MSDTNTSSSERPYVEAVIRTEMSLPEGTSESEALEAAEEVFADEIESDEGRVELNFHGEKAEMEDGSLLSEHFGEAYKLTKEVQKPLMKAARAGVVDPELPHKLGLATQQITKADPNLSHEVVYNPDEKSTEEQ